MRVPGLQTQKPGSLRQVRQNLERTGEEEQLGTAGD